MFYGVAASLECREQGGHSVHQNRVPSQLASERGTSKWAQITLLSFNLLPTLRTLSPSKFGMTLARAMAPSGGMRLSLGRFKEKEVERTKSWWDANREYSWWDGSRDIQLHESAVHLEGISQSHCSILPKPVVSQVQDLQHLVVLKASRTGKRDTRMHEWRDLLTNNRPISICFVVVQLNFCRLPNFWTRNFHTQIF